MQCAWHSASRLGLSHKSRAANHAWLWPSDWTAQVSWLNICAKHLHYASRVAVQAELSKCIHMPCLQGPGFPELGGTAGFPGRLRQPHQAPVWPPSADFPLYINRMFSFPFQALRPIFLPILFFYSWPLNAPSSPLPEVFFVGIVKLEWGCSGSRWGHQSPGRELRTEARAVVSRVGRDYLQQHLGLGP